MNNQVLLQKADLAIADLTANGGLLEPEQADAFIVKLIDQPTILGKTRVVPMSAPTRKVNKIGFDTRILHAGVASTALAAADRSAPTTSQITLTSKEVIAEVHLPYDVIEDNIERGNIGTRTDTSTGGSTGGIKDTIMTMIASRAALDLEELALLGDVTLATATPADAYLGLLDGYLKLSTVNVVDQGTVAITKAMFSNGLKAMPSRFLRNQAAMRHYLSPSQVVSWRDLIADRATVLGDQAMQGTNVVYGLGVQVDPVPLMPDASGMLTYPQNLIWGIERNIHVETDKDIRAREYIIVLTARVDFQIESVDAVVKYINIA